MIELERLVISVNERMAMGKLTKKFVLALLSLSAPFISHHSTLGGELLCNGQPLNSSFEGPRDDGKHYLRVGQSLAFEEARSLCQSLNKGDLPILKSELEMSELIAFIEEGTVSQTWVGLTNPAGVVCTLEGCQGQLLWVDETEFEAFPTIMAISADFAPNPAHCFRIFPSALPPWSGNDYTCSHLFNVVCTTTCDFGLATQSTF